MHPFPTRKWSSKKALPEKGAVNPLHLFLAIFTIKTGEKWHFRQKCGSQRGRWPNILSHIYIYIYITSLSLSLSFPLSFHGMSLSIYTKKISISISISLSLFSLSFYTFYKLFSTRPPTLQSATEN